ncbi:hypothetical protein TNCV_3033571 [Trichonephila clavipes]|nr:hypothetical protein TNCV_3033571 [Trichonephila clavipes]
MACYRQTGIRAKQTLLESPEVLLQGCGIDSKKQEMLDVPGAGRPRATASSYDRYIQLTARRNRTENAKKTVALGNRTKGVGFQTARNRLQRALCT